jgi:hypothetical protein
VAAAGSSPPASLGPAGGRGLVRRTAARLRGEWLPGAAWAIRRTGRTGLVGIALLLGAVLFLLSTHLQVASEVEALRADVAAARSRPRAAAEPVAEPAAAMRALPARTDMPAMLGQLYDGAARAHLAVNTARYELYAVQGGGVVRHRITFPVSGPYPQIRSFIDSTLAAMPAVALTGLVLERKSIGSGSVEAEIRITVFTRSAP